MTPTEIANVLGCTLWNIAKLLQTAMKKLRAHRQSVAMGRFVEAVTAKRQWIDAREPNRPWFDIDAGGEGL